MRTLQLPAERTLRLTLRFGPLIVFALGRERAAQRIHSLLLPGFFATLRALFGMAASPVLWNALWVSNQAMLLGFNLSVLVVITVLLVMLAGRLCPRLVT